MSQKVEVGSNTDTLAPPARGHPGDLRGRHDVLAVSRSRAVERRTKGQRERARAVLLKRAGIDTAALEAAAEKLAAGGRTPSFIVVDGPRRTDRGRRPPDRRRP